MNLSSFSSARLLNEYNIELELDLFLSVNETSRALIESNRARLASYLIRLTALVAIRLTALVSTNKVNDEKLPSVTAPIMYFLNFTGFWEHNKKELGSV